MWLEIIRGFFRRFIGYSLFSGETFLNQLKFDDVYRRHEFGGTFLEHGHSVFTVFQRSALRSAHASLLTAIFPADGPGLSGLPIDFSYSVCSQPVYPTS